MYYKYKYYDYDNMTQKELRDLALSQEEWVIRWYAVQRLTDQKTLKRIALNKKEILTVRETAVQHLTDQETLKKIALMNKMGWGFRQLAIDKLTDQEFLKYLELNDNCWMVRELAKARLAELNK